MREDGKVLMIGNNLAGINLYIILGIRKAGLVLVWPSKEKRGHLAAWNNPFTLSFVFQLPKMSYKPIIHRNLLMISYLSKSSSILLLRNGKMMIKKILDIKESKSEGVIEFESSI